MYANLFFNPRFSLTETSKSEKRVPIGEDQNFRFKVKEASENFAMDTIEYALVNH